MDFASKSCENVQFYYRIFTVCSNYAARDTTHVHICLMLMAALGGTAL